MPPPLHRLRRRPLPRQRQSLPQSPVEKPVKPAAEKPAKPAGATVAGLTSSILAAARRYKTGTCPQVAARRC